MIFQCSEQRGFAFIEFENKSEAEEAIQHLDHQNVCGSIVTVSIAKNNRKSSEEMRRIYNSRRSRSRSRSIHRRYHGRTYMKRSRSSSHGRRYYRGRPSRRYEGRPYYRRGCYVCSKHISTLEQVKTNTVGQNQCVATNP